MESREYLGIFVAALIGFVATLILGAFSVIILYADGMITVIFLFEILFIFLGLIIGNLFPEQGWRLGFFLSFTYSVWLFFILLNTLSYHSQYDEVFWHQEFFPSALLLYLLPIFITCVSANAGANISFRNVSLIGAVFILSIISAFHVKSYKPITDSQTFSVNLIENKDLHLQAEIKCERETNKDPMRFRNYDNGQCRDSKIFVIKNNTNYSLPTTFSWTIDDVEESLPISPKMEASDSFGIDMSKSQNFEDVKVWMLDIPSGKIAQSQQVNFKWGKINIEFGEPELKIFRELGESQKRFIYKTE